MGVGGDEVGFGGGVVGGVREVGEDEFEGFVGVLEEDEGAGDGGGVGVDEQGEAGEQGGGLGVEDEDVDEAGGGFRGGVVVVADFGGAFSEAEEFEQEFDGLVGGEFYDTAF